MEKKPLLYALLAAPFFLIIASPLIVIAATVVVIGLGYPLFEWGVALWIGVAVAVFYMLLASAITYKWSKEAEDPGPDLYPTAK